MPAETDYLGIALARRWRRALGRLRRLAAVRLDPGTPIVVAAHPMAVADAGLAEDARAAEALVAAERDLARHLLETGSELEADGHLFKLDGHGRLKAEGRDS